MAAAPIPTRNMPIRMTKRTSRSDALKQKQKKTHQSSIEMKYNDYLFT